MSRIGNWFRRSFEPELETKSLDETTTFSEDLKEAIQFGLLPTGHAGQFARNHAVYTVVEFLASQISQVGLKAYQRVSDTDRQSLADTDLARLIDQPAPGLTYERFMHGTIADLCVFGNAYWLKQQAGEDRALVPLPPFGVTPRGGNVVQAARYDFAMNGGVQTFAADQIVHFRRYNPADRRIGLSPLDPLRSILREDQEASLARIGFWRNSARMGGLLERDPAGTPWNEDDYKTWRTKFKNTLSGSQNTGEWAVLMPGMKAVPTEWSAKDSEFIEGRKSVVEAVARALGVPLSVLGLTETATYASEKEFHKQLYVDTLGPYFKIVQGEMARSVVPWFTNDRSVYVEFNVQEKLRGSFEEQADAVRAYGGVPIMSVNELRALFNLPKIDDPAFDRPVMPANVLYGGAGSPGEAPMPADVVRLAPAN